MLQSRQVPLRVFTLRRDDYIVDEQLERLKKKRDRYLKLFKKEGSLKDLKTADSLSIRIKKVIKRCMRRRFQLKATSPDPKVFWKAVKNIKGQHRDNTSIELMIGNKKLTSSSEISECFADFFIDKANKLSSRTSCEGMDFKWESNQNCKFIITKDMVLKAVASLKERNHMELMVSHCALSKTPILTWLMRT